MILRFFGSTTRGVMTALAFFILAAGPAQADGPKYTYLGLSYEFTDIKYGVTPKGDLRFNNGSFEGENIDLSVGILSWLHVTGQAFGYLNGTCSDCNSDPAGNRSDADMEAFKVGLGVNLGLDLIGLSENVDLVLRGNYIDTTLKNLGPGSPSDISDDGWSAEGMIRGQVSENTDVYIGYEYHRLTDVRNRDMTVGLNFQVVDGLTILGRAIVFDNETGFEIGLRWQFGALAFGGHDSIGR